MIIPEGSDIENLDNYRQGKIGMGLGINVPKMDDHIRFKRGQFNIILGHDNLGKTYWTEWYFLALSSHHDLTWTIWAGENKSWAMKRDLIQMYAKKYFKDLSYDEMRKWMMKIEHWFKFVDNKILYTPDQLLDIFDKNDSDGYLIDPFTGLDREFSHEGNYRFLNKTRKFVNETQKTIYMSSHPTSESGRTNRLYPKDHDYAGALMPPLKDHIEGGKPFANRVDDFFIIHRLVKIPHMKYTTIVDVAKVKDTETGGKQTVLEGEIYCDYNSGLGFAIDGIEGIKRNHNTGNPFYSQNPLAEEMQNFYEPLKREKDMFDPPESDLPF